MHKQTRFRYFMSIRNIACLIILCMLIGDVYIPAIAKESSGIRSALEDGNDAASDPLTDSIPKTEPEDEESEPDSDLADNEEIDRETGENAKEDAAKEETSEETEENTMQDEEEPASDDGIDDDDIEEKKPEEDIKESKDTPDIPDIVNVVVPVNYVLALNPYGLPIKTGKDKVVTEQVISGTYGIVNKSSNAQIVSIELSVEDMNDGKLIFVDSAEEAKEAGEGVYAVYLAAVPADENEILVDGAPADENTVGESLQNVKMHGAREKAVTLYSGTNHIAFKLSGAVYSLKDDGESVLNDTEDETLKESLEAETLKETPEAVLSGLAPDGSGVTAYTFYGAMNPNAEWEKLSGGIKISVVYTYSNADGSEKIIEGTGAMVNID
ncbi:MAG: hypothetical protein HDR29_07225 [Lachnospiraceae bacterium]|nr:hypothetical protein [Lachnospiraceae bacterium]